MSCNGTRFPASFALACAAERSFEIQCQCASKAATRLHLKVGVCQELCNQSGTRPGGSALSVSRGNRRQNLSACPLAGLSSNTTDLHKVPGLPWHAVGHDHQASPSGLSYPASMCVFHCNTCHSNKLSNNAHGMQTFRDMRLCTSFSGLSSP